MLRSALALALALACTPELGEWGMSDSDNRDDEPASCVRMVEVFTSPFGPAQGRQFVDIFNFCDEPVNLARFSLRWTAGTGAFAHSLPLVGVLYPGTCATVGGPESVPANGMAEFALHAPFVPSMPKIVRDDVAAAVGIFPLHDIDTVSDVLVFGGPNTLNITTPDGIPSEGEATIPEYGFGLSRWGATWFPARPTPCGGQLH